MITAEFYQTVSDLIDSSQLRGEDIVFYIDKMAVDLDNSEIGVDDKDREILDSQILITSDVMEKRHNTYTTQVLNFVFVLQQYIDNNYPLINNFLSDNDIKVKVVFADISLTVGYLIDPSNIEGSS